MADPVRLERDGAVAVLVLDDPPLNLFGREAFEALDDAGRRGRGLRRAGAGLARRGRGLHRRRRRQRASHGTTAGATAARCSTRCVAGVRRLEALPIPTLALVHGLCLTAGLEVSLGCDLIWATESARFGLVEAVVGLTPGAGRHAADGRARRARRGRASS